MTMHHNKVTHNLRHTQDNTIYFSLVCKVVYAADNKISDVYYMLKHLNYLLRTSR